MKNCVCESSFDVEVVCTRHHNADWFHCSSVMSTVQAGLRRPLRLALLPLLHRRFRQQGLSATLVSSSLHLHTHTHTFNGPFSGTTRVSPYQKGKTNLDFTEARDSEWQWHQLGHMQVHTSLQIDNHASTPPLSFFTGRIPFLPPNQQRQSTEGTCSCKILRSAETMILQREILARRISPS